MMKRWFLAPIVVVFASACASSQPAALATQKVDPGLTDGGFERALKVRPIEQAAPDTYRILWHPWHMNTAAIGVTRRDGFNVLEVSQTDGFGTYTVGEFKTRRSAPISEAEFKRVAEAFLRLDELQPQADPWTVAVVNRETGEESLTVCIHAPSFYLEQRRGDVARSIYRYCHPDYQRDFEIARPLIDLAWAKFPRQMKEIDSDYLVRQMQAEDGKSDR
jgi:hypothetical protein